MDLERSGEFNVWSNKEAAMPKITVARITDGLEFGEGTISLNDRLDGQVNQIDHVTVLQVESVIESHDILVPVDVDDDLLPIEDDGCGDGRAVKRIFKGRFELKRSLNRAKAFGGGLVMAVASTIGSGKASGQQLNAVFDNGMIDLEKKSIPYGAHTDDHASGPNGGCGAIDKSPFIIHNVSKYQEQIRATIKQLTQGGYDENKLKQIFSNYQSYGLELQDDDSYSGREIAEKILDKSKVVKELEGPHLETHIVINTVHGFTVNQEAIRQISGSKAQVFAVDAWHMQDIANKLYEDPSDQVEAYLSMLVYTLATAATLTKGDLPVYIVGSEA